MAVAAAFLFIVEWVSVIAAMWVLPLLRQRISRDDYGLLRRRH